jgi:N-acetyl sugar amidotransferase
LLHQIKNAGIGRGYDCIMGLSGGVDSSYLLHLAVKVWNLRVLAVHVNAGWNSETAESNIERLVNELNVDLYTYVVDWEEMRNLQLAYLKSGVINQDIPQDHVFFAQLYKRATKERISFVLTGHNLATESILPKSWGYDAMDSKQLKYINNKFGKGKLKSYTTISLIQRLYYTFFLKQRVVKPLDLINYDKEEAKKFLKNQYGWQDYGVKHGESVFTRFYQNYWLPTRYGFDKRKAHLSSLIISRFITREDAIKQLNEPLYDDFLINIDKQYICNKLEISEEQLDAYLNINKVEHSAYPSNEFIFNILMKVYNKMRGV